ncbi:ORF6N domain-containing protein [Sulfurovum sp. TSL1]|uniref:ORF6N domain-containing protein n=1 Tax=Sulfurovum sp. TSL1 TaxID=2826994 RepID=UPI001CC6FD15|nr:ORF6N domain-containing protein [Sulfurovum sp. TSL1]GIT98156.1 DNA-binding protein [Sulfurovum sp. TSL1]
MDEMMVQGEISSRIYTIRGEQVMLDRDLAAIYKVETKVLNQAVKRNIKRFPSDFMFQLNDAEKNELVTKCDRFKTLKHSSVNPYAFTEQGVYMLATVLKSDVAIEVNIAIMRTFTKLREFSKHYNALAKKIIEVERKSDRQYKELTKALDELIEESKAAQSKTIGFIQPEQ